MKKYKYAIVISSIIVLAGIAFLIFHKHIKIREYTEIDSVPDIFPEYVNTAIPPNIAPLNFIINNAGEKYYVSIHSENGRKINILAKRNKIIIPERKWKNLLENNKGNKVLTDIFIKKEGKGWHKYKSIENTIACDPMDSYIVFRLINPGYILWEEMGIYQRNIENYARTPVMLNRTTEKNCMNCHTFCKNDPDKMLLHLRSKPSGTILYNNGKAVMLNTSTPFTMSACVYPSWHPDGNIIAFSVNKINQKFHSAKKSTNLTVFDRASDLVLYDIDKNMITTCPEVSTKRMENLPNWSPDGKYLYYISGPEYDMKLNDTLVQYDLLRISYDVNEGTWGKVDTILTAKETGKSISYPEVSPDGKYLLFCMADYGYFNIHNPGSDLYLMDLETSKYRKLSINSNHVESFHSWSSNSRWFLFSSKRIDGLNARVYFSYIDKEGNVYNPVLLPQKDPAFYESFIYNYNRPVFIKDKIDIDSYKLTKVAYSQIVKADFDPEVDIDALSGATRIKREY